MLRDLDDRYGKAAVLQLCGSCEFPPSISQIRQMALNLASGSVSPPSAWEAWETALQGRYEALGEIGKRALAAIGGAWALKKTGSPGVERSNFIRAYTEFLDRYRADRLAIPEVLQLAHGNAPAIPARVPEQEHDHTQAPGFEPVTAEMVRDVISSFTRAYTVPE